MDQILLTMWLASRGMDLYIDISILYTIQQTKEKPYFLLLFLILLFTQGGAENIGGLIHNLIQYFVTGKEIFLLIKLQKLSMVWLGK